MRFDELLDDRKADARAAAVARARFFGAIEAFENQRQIVIRQRFTGVREHDPNPAWRPFHCNAHAAAVRRKFPGVVEQVLQDLGELFGIRDDFDRLVRCFSFDGDRFFGELVFEEIEAMGKQFAEIDFSAFERQTRGIGHAQAQ